jgi:hypothetical protein
VQDAHAPSFVGSELPSHPKPRQERRVRATTAFKRCRTPPPAAGDTWTWARRGRFWRRRSAVSPPGGGPTNSTPAPAARARSSRRRVPAREDPGGGGPARAAAPLGPVLDHPSALAAGRTPAGSRPRSPVRWSARRRSRCTGPGHARQARHAGRLGRWAPGAPCCLPGRRRSVARGCARAGLPRQSEDGGRCEFEESLPSRRSSSIIRVCSVTISAEPARRWTRATRR